MARERSHLRALKNYVDTKSPITADATQTLTNKTLTTPVIASMYQNAGKTQLMTLPNTASDTLVGLAATQTLTNKTLTSPKISDGHQNVTVTSANQTHATPVVTIPDIGDAADEFVMKDTTQTLTNKTLTAPVVTSPDLTFGVSTHDYEAGAVAWTLSAAELKSTIITATNANGAVDAIATPTAGKVYIVSNGTGQALTFKATGQTGVVVANTKTAIVRGNGTDFVRVTADA